MAYPPPRKAPGFAVASLSTGVAGLVLAACLSFFPVLPVLAFVFGHLAMSRINREYLPGRGLAIAGLVTGYIGLALSVLLLILILIGTFTSPTPTF